MQEWFASITSFQDLLGVPAASTQSVPGAPGAAANPPVAEGATCDGPEPRFAAGDLVEYNSASQGGWIPAKVLQRRPDGCYDLDCKPNVHWSKIRSPGQVVPEYEVGSIVEYLSESQGGYIPARVTGFNPATGLYELDCKPRVIAGKIRKPVLRPGASSGRSEAPRPIPGSLGSIPETAEATEATEATEADVHVPPTVDSLRAPEAGGTPSFRPVPRAAPGDHGPEVRPVQPQPVPTGTMLQEERGGSTSSASSPHVMRPPTLSTASGPVPAQDGPLQLVRVSRRGSGWHFEVNEEAAKVLEAYGQRLLTICTVCGPYRTGKSYLLNLLLRRVQRGLSQFRVGSSTRACTEGIWIWGAGNATGESTSLLFVDCEGFGSTDSDRHRDAKLMSLCLLISSVFLLNTKGVLNEGLFNALSLVCNLAEHVEEQGRETSKPILLWLLRDFILDLRDEQDRSVTPDQYLEQALYAKPLAGSDTDRAQAAKDVRENLLRFFPQRHCQTLVQPLIDEDKLRQLAEVPYTDLRPEFRSEFEALEAKLLNLTRAHPKTIGGNPVTASGLVALVRRLVEALNANSVLNIGSAWDHVQHSACDALVQELGAACSEALRKVRDGGPLPIPGGQSLPVGDDVLAQSLKEGRRMVRQAFRARAFGDEAVRASYWEALRTTLADQEKGIVQLNESLADERLRAAGAQWEAWLGQEGSATAADARSEALVMLVNQGMPSRPTSRAVAQALNVARMSRIRWDASMDALKAELKLVNDDLESRIASVHAQAAAKFDDSQLESTREIGRLNGQVEMLQSQAREAIQREKMLKQQVLEAEERTRTEQRTNSEVQRKCLVTIRDLEAQVGDLKRQAEVLQREQEEQAQAKAPADRGTQPKCTCNVM